MEGYSWWWRNGIVAAASGHLFAAIEDSRAGSAKEHTSIIEMPSAGSLQVLSPVPFAYGFRFRN